MHATMVKLKAIDARLDMVEHALATNHDSFSRFFMGTPVPAWIKRTDGVMVISNEAYERAYGIAPEDYVESTDGRQWRQEEARAFSKLDQRAADTNTLVLGVEPILNPSTRKHEDLFVAKWPVAWDRSGCVTEVAGMVLAALAAVEPSHDRQR